MTNRYAIDTTNLCHGNSYTAQVCKTIRSVERKHGPLGGVIFYKSKGAPLSALNMLPVPSGPVEKILSRNAEMFDTALSMCFPETY
jgi:hypothetical protein